MCHEAIKVQKYVIHSPVLSRFWQSQGEYSISPVELNSTNVVSAS